MKRLCIFFSLFILFFSLTGCAKSTDKYVMVDVPYQLKNISMYDANNGWALSMENEILFTDNGIKNFTPIWKFDDLNKAGDYFIDVCFVDAQNVYAAYFSENSDLTVEYTKDGGDSWQQTMVKWEDDLGNNLLEAGGSVFLSFSDAENGYLLYCSTPAAGLMTKLLFRTTDAGENFFYVEDLSELSGYPQGISVSDEISYIAVTSRGEDHYLYVRKNREDAWSSEEVIPLPEGVRYMDGYAPMFSRKDKQKGGMVLKTVGDDIGYLLLVTSDGGENWVQNGSIPLDSMKSYTCIDDHTFYFIDDTGNLYEYFLSTI